MFCKPITGIFVAAVEPDKLYILISPWFKCRKGLFPEKSKLTSFHKPISAFRKGVREKKYLKYINR